MMSRAIGPFAYASSVLVWIAIVITGFAMLAVYSNTPSELGEPPSLNHVQLSEAAWRKSVAGTPYHLVMAIHPQCPCTLASIAQLDRLLAKCNEGVACTVLVFQPSDHPETWNETTLVANAQRLPRTQVVIDRDGEMIQRLQLKTSGAVVVYSEAGETLFSGGLTPSRGHEGDSLGCDSILSLVRKGSTELVSCPVYGCPLEHDSEPNSSVGGRG